MSLLKNGRWCLRFVALTHSCMVLWLLNFSEKSLWLPTWWYQHGQVLIKAFFLAYRWLPSSYILTRPFLGVCVCGGGNSTALPRLEKAVSPHLLSLSANTGKKLNLKNEEFYKAAATESRGHLSISKGIVMSVRVTCFLFAHGSVCVTHTCTHTHL